MANVLAKKLLSFSRSVVLGSTSLRTEGGPSGRFLVAQVKILSSLSIQPLTAVSCAGVTSPLREIMGNCRTNTNHGYNQGYEKSLR